MSFVGNFTSNYDRTLQTAGASTTTSPTWHRRPSVSSHHGSEHSTAAHRRPSIGSRHGSVTTALRRSLSRPGTAGEDIPPVPPIPTGKEDSSDSDEAQEVRRLARAYSHVSTTDGGTDRSPFEAAAGSSLDPASDNFRARAWTKAMLGVHAGNEKGFKPRTAGVAFRNLSAFGYSAPTDYQKTVGNYALDLVGLARRAMGHGPNRVDILRDCEGLVRAGEMLVVLGPPGSGCTTFLKTIAGETHGFNLSKESQINYQGISYQQMHKHFRGEVLYTAEQDVHFPMLTVGDTLLFAAHARSPRIIPGGVSRDTYAQHMRDVVMATFGIRHTLHTKVGNDFVRGVSGGERKRVSIAEAALSNAPLQCWDNSTRGLDSANAVEFCKTLRNSTELANACAAVAIYQGPESAIQQFDKAIVLYEGRQIYFGHINRAVQFFEEMGFECPDRQTTADFLTSMTSPAERVVKPGWETRVPRTPDEFAERWKSSEMRQNLLAEIKEYEQEHPIGGEDLKNFKESRRIQQAKQQRVASPYTLSYLGQVRLCLWRGFRRLSADPSLTITQIVGNSCNALIVGSLFYNQSMTTTSLQSRSALLFFAVLLNAFGSALEILMLYAQRPIVEKHTRYALYHPSAEAFASMLTDIPAKVGQSIAFNLILYFLTNLRREPGAFFFFLMMTFVLTLTMSMMFRTIASVSRSLVQALVPTAIIMISIIIYTGFTIPISYMQGWARWINYINPTAYGFESLMINEFSGQNYTCAMYVPPAPYFGDGTTTRQVCTAVGSIAGETIVQGERYLESSFQYYAVHKWRNLGILFAFMIGFLITYLVATEFISEKKSKGEVLLFRRGYKPASLEEKASTDPEAQKSEAGPKLERGLSHKEVGAMLQKQTAIFQWRDVCFDIKIKSETRRILDHVDGWVEPGTMTALMGVSGAGKTTLLDVLATRVTMGVVTGEMLIDGRVRDESFQRKTGYVQQQDLHLQTSTVREALNFSALLRQPADTPRSEKLAYVDEVIKLLEMEDFADAIVGVPGEGLNVEQRKRLTIGVELAARPQIMCFLDEPTSGLDSQTSWSILDLLEKLTRNGQAILCTIHQPSAMLFQRFNRLLLLQSGGQTVYFGNIGENAQILSDYFVRNGASPCPPTANPAEWMLSVIGAAPGSYTDIDWFQTWRKSPEYKAVQNQLDTWKKELPETTQPVSNPNEKADYREFAAPFYVQFLEVQRRIFQQYWRTPSYIYSKLSLCILTGLFIGFSFYRAPNTQQGLQNQLFGIFMLLTLFSQLVQQIMPNFVVARALYESRERPSKTYSWIAFMLSNTLVELPWAILSGVLLFFCWYYPIGLYTDAAYSDAVTSRGALVFLLILTFLLFSSTFAHMVIAGIETAETAGNVANLMFSFSLLFNGVLVGPKAMPGFWIFMYRISPFTYLVEGLLSASVANAPVMCAANEYLHFDAPAGATCEQYLGKFITEAGGYLLDPKASQCAYCAISSTNTYLSAVSISFGNAWRDFGLMWVYIIFNIIAGPLIYWLARVPKGSKQRREVAKAAAPLEEKAALKGLAAVEKDDEAAGEKDDEEAVAGAKDVEAAVERPTTRASTSSHKTDRPTTPKSAISVASSDPARLAHVSSTPTQHSSPQMVRTVTPVEEIDTETDTATNSNSGPPSRPEMERMVTASEEPTA